MKRIPSSLFPPIDRDSSTLALRPVLISGMVTPVQGGDGGVNINIVGPAGGNVLAALDPWQRMAEGDYVQIYWDDTQLGERTVQAGDVDQRLFFNLPNDPIVPDWAEKVFYRLIRQGGTTPEDSIALRIRVKLDHPGGVDKDPHLPGHSELAAPGLPQDVINNGVDAEWAKRGVPVVIAPYPGRAARDTIQLKWGDALLEHVVTESEAQGDEPITLTVEQAKILEGGDAPGLLVHYQVFDEVWNFSTDWSLQTYVDVEAGAQKLDAPIINEAFNGVIDLGDLGDSDVTVSIEVRDVPFELGDTITLTWVGTPTTGAPRVYTDSTDLTDIPSIVEIKVPNAELRAIIEGTVLATYVLTKADGSPPLSSKRALARVTGQIPLPKPTVFEAVGDTLDPGLPQAHVGIPVYPDRAVGDLIDLIWLGTSANGTPLLYETQHILSASELGEILYLPVMSEHIAPLANGTLDVSYRVSNDAVSLNDVRASDHLHLTVHTRSAELPAPSVDEAEDNVLDPEKVREYATYRMPYTGTAVGDTLTWYWQGESLEGSASDWTPITQPVAGKPLTFNIPRSLIDPNVNNIVKLYYSLKLASTGDYQYSEVFELAIGKPIGQLPAPEVVEASNGTLDPMLAQTGATVRVRYDSMTPEDVITLSWMGTPGAGSPPDQSLFGSASGQVDFPISASVIGANIAQDVIILYHVKRTPSENSSELCLLHVQAIADAQLPIPVVAEADAQSKTLNLATFTGNATTTVAKWPFIAVGQRVWLRLEGQADGGVHHDIVLLDGQAITAAHVSAGLSETVPRAELEKLAQDTSLTVICDVAFSESAVEGTALPLPRQVYQFKRHHDWVAPVIVSVKDGKGEVANGGTTFDTTLDLSGTGTIDTELEILDGANSLITTRTTTTGTWATKLTALRAKTYSVAAKALDGSGLVSPLRTWEVLANITPTIEQVLDSDGPVSNGGTTVDTALTISGRASPDQYVEVFDGTGSKGTAVTDSDGAWTHVVSGLAVASHTFKAKALYGTTPESALWTILVTASVAPTISNLTDSEGTPIPHGGFTVDTSIALTGTASANLEVEVFDGATSKGKATANASGVWTLSLTGLTVAAHALKAKALYGSGATSAERTFTIVAMINPTITSVVDPKNAAVANGGSTFATSVTVSGKASINQTVEVFDGAASKGTVTANSSGDWTRAISGLSVASHSLTAKALYGAKPVSPAWTFTVKADTAPTITSVRDSKGEVANGGQTTDTSVTASGKAAASEQVEVFDGATSKGTATANASGDWSRAVSGLALGAHSLKATAKYGSGASSGVRTFTVKSPVPDFVLDTSAISLNGQLYGLAGYPGHAPLNWPAGTTANRVPSSGAPPYTYTSSNPSVVLTDTAGNIYSIWNGTATINVRDSQGRSGSYTVTVSNVTMVYGLGNLTYKAAVSAAQGRGLRIPSIDELRAIHAMYGARFPMGDWHYWSSTGAGLYKNYVKYLVSGAESSGNTLGGWYSNVVAL